MKSSMYILYTHFRNFSLVPENSEEKIKRQLIEKALEKDSNTTLEQWRQFARSEYGLINGLYYEIHVRTE